MRWRSQCGSWFRFGFLIVVFAVTLTLAAMVGLPIAALALLAGVVSVSSVGTIILHPTEQKSAAWELWLGVLTSIPACWSIAFGSHALDYYYGMLAGLVALALSVAECSAENRGRILSWRGLGLMWGLFGLLLTLVVSYSKNQPTAFFCGLAGIVILLVLAKQTLPLSGLLIQAINTFIILLPGLWLADLLCFRAAHEGKVPTLAERPYSYESFQRDPAAYVRWTDYINAQSRALYRAMFLVSPGGDMTFVVRSNVSLRLCEAEFRINNLGFRGRDFSINKDQAYRIVALGESTTFGITLEAQSRPWCEWLEEMIQRELQPAVRVEVINAGTPGVGLRHNLQRLREQILQLRPDLIISYHGYNQFPEIDQGLPSVRTRIPPPQYVARPLELLAQVEYRWRMIKYARLVAPSPANPIPPGADLLHTPYADDYRELIQICRENHVRLVLATYAMAVNASSDSQVVDFYHRGVPLLNRQIRACAAHADLVKKLAELNPEVGLIDTQPAMDGQHDYYIDLVHFTAAGDRRMAETMFAGVKELLIQELAHSP